MKQDDFVEISIEIGKFKEAFNSLVASGAVAKGKDGKYYANIQIGMSKERKYDKSLSASLYDKVNKTKVFIGNGNMKTFKDGKIEEINLHEAKAEVLTPEVVGWPSDAPQSTKAMLQAKQDEKTPKTDDLPW